jgi:hypothetical protein
MAHDQSPLPVSMLHGPSGLGTSAARIPWPATGDPCSGGNPLPGGGGAGASEALIAAAPVETVRSVASALIALTLTDDPSVRRSLPELAERVQREMRRLMRTS